MTILYPIRSDLSSRLSLSQLHQRLAVHHHQLPYRRRIVKIRRLSFSDVHRTLKLAHQCKPLLGKLVDLA